MTLDPIRIQATCDAIRDAEARGKAAGWREAMDHVRDLHQRDPLMPVADVLHDLHLERQADRLHQHRERWPLLAMVAARLVDGEVEYGNASLDRPIARTIDEIRQELADVAGWACVMDRQLGRIMVAADEVLTQDTATPKDGAP